MRAKRCEIIEETHYECSVCYDEIEGCDLCGTFDDTDSWLCEEEWHFCSKECRKLFKQRVKVKEVS